MSVNAVITDIDGNFPEVNGVITVSSSTGTLTVYTVTTGSYVAGDYEYVLHTASTDIVQETATTDLDINSYDTFVYTVTDGSRTISSQFTATIVDDDTSHETFSIVANDSDVVITAADGNDVINVNYKADGGNIIDGGSGIDTINIDANLLKTTGTSTSMEYSIVDNNDGTHTIADGSLEIIINDIETINFEDVTLTYDNGDWISSVDLSGVSPRADADADTNIKSATVIDAIVSGLEYKTSSGLFGITEVDGSFDYLDGDTVIFNLGNITLGSIDMNSISDNQVFLQDIAGTLRTDVNDEYLENMAVLLQSIDSDNDAYNGIVITQAMRDAFSDESFDLSTISEQDLSDIIQSTGRVSVSEDDAMEHVQDMLVEYTDLEQNEFDVRTDDDRQLNEPENLILAGSEEDDILVAGLGSDTLSGGAGADTFVFESADTGDNVINDYNQDEGDIIVLNDLLVDDSDTLDAHLSVMEDDNGSIKIEIKDNPDDAEASSSITLDNLNFSDLDANNPLDDLLTKVNIDTDMP